MKTHRLMSRVREKAGLLKLLLGLAFLFFGLLKQVNIAVEGKQKVRFSHLFPLQWFYSPVGQKFSNKNLYRRFQWMKKKNDCDWFGIACANRRFPPLFFVTTPYLARAHVCRRFVFNPCPRDAVQRSGSARGVVVYQYTRKKFAKIPKNTQNSSQYTQNRLKRCILYTQN